MPKKLTDSNALDQLSPEEILIIISNLREVLDNTVSGDVAEFGCFLGKTSVIMQSELVNSQKELHVYDSFEGLPEKTKQDYSPVGEQFRPGELYATKKQLVRNFVKANLPLPVIHKGWFASLSTNDVPDKLCFAFLDGDYYESIRQSLELVWPALQSNAKVLIDDYNSEALPGVRKAVDSWITSHPIKYFQVQSSLAIIQIR